MNQVGLVSATSNVYFYKTLLEYKNKLHVIRPLKEIRNDKEYLSKVFE